MLHSLKMQRMLLSTITATLRARNCRQLLCIAIHSAASSSAQHHHHSPHHVVKGKGSHRPPKKFHAFPFDYQETIICTVDAISGMGMGVARVDISHKPVPFEKTKARPPNHTLALDTSADIENAEGEVASDKDIGIDIHFKDKDKEKRWVVLIPTVLPGEKVKVRVFRNSKGYSEADLLEVITSSPDRVKPQCKYFAACGGCQYQMAPLNLQRQWKRERVMSLMERIAGVDLQTIGVTVDECLGTDRIYGYRSKLTPHYNAPKSPAELKIGFHVRGKREVLDVDHCVIATDTINKAYTAARTEIYDKMVAASREKELRGGAGTEQYKRSRGATLLFREGEDMISSMKTSINAVSSSSETPANEEVDIPIPVYVETDSRKTVKQSVLGIVFEYKAGEFFQNNAHVLPFMVQRVLNLATGHDCNYLIDAYCGSGLFSLLAHEHFKTVYGVEISQQAVEAAVANAERNLIRNVQFTLGSSASIFRDFIDDQGQGSGNSNYRNDHGEFAPVQGLDRDKTVVLLDPPRKGCDDAFLGQLLLFRPRKIVYVSCEPATQMRDAKMILEQGYKIVAVTPIDLFPQTRHIENIVCFVRE